MTMETVLAMTSDVLATALMGLVVLSFATAKKFLTAKIELIKGEQERQIAANALSRADHIAEKLVKKMQQTLVIGMKEASSDGKLTADEIKNIGYQTEEELRQLMNEDLRESLVATVKDVDLYMKNLIESKVFELKQNKKVEIEGFFDNTGMDGVADPEM